MLDYWGLTAGPPPINRTVDQKIIFTGFLLRGVESDTFLPGRWEIWVNKMAFYLVVSQKN